MLYTKSISQSGDIIVQSETDALASLVYCMWPVTKRLIMKNFNPLKGRDVNWLQLAIQV